MKPIHGPVDLTADSYDRVAEAYAGHFLGELDTKPLDRMLLDLLIAQVDGLGSIADIGCGPGHVARYLHDHGAPALGIDLSPRMVEVAATAHPGIGFRVGDMRALDVPDQSWGGLVAFYSIIHLPPEALRTAAAEFLRVLKPGGHALISFHLTDSAEIPLTDGIRHMDEFLGEPVDLDFHFHSRATVESAFASAGFVQDVFIERNPYESEVRTTRAYLLAHRSV